MTEFQVQTMVNKQELLVRSTSFVRYMHAISQHTYKMGKAYSMMVQIALLLPVENASLSLCGHIKGDSLHICIFFQRKKIYFRIELTLFSVVFLLLYRLTPKQEKEL